jgi:prevent-host-death family protein
MQQINIHAAKTHLSSLVDKAAAGEPFIIAKAGKPLAIVKPYEPTATCPRIGFLKGLVTIPDDFDILDRHEITDMFEGVTDQ